MRSTRGPSRPPRPNASRRFARCIPRYVWRPGRADDGALTLGQIAQPIESRGTAYELASGAAGPLVCIRRLGKGTVLYLGATVWAGDGAAQMLIREALEAAGVRRRAWIKDAAGGAAWQARALAMDCGSGTLIGVAHYRPYAEQEPLSDLQVGVRTKGKSIVHRLSDARPYVRDDNRRERVESSAANGYTTFKTNLRPHEVRFFVVEPA